MVAAINGQAHVLIDTGDCTDNGTEEESLLYSKLVNGNIAMLWRAVPGNHDSPDTFASHISPLEWSWDVRGYRLIGINSEAINYQALDAALTTEKPCIVFGHYPLFDYPLQIRRLCGNVSRLMPCRCMSVGMTTWIT
jgi:hypothetical protein